MPQKSKSSRSYLLIVLIAATFLGLGERLVYLQVSRGAYSKTERLRHERVTVNDNGGNPQGTNQSSATV